MPGIADTEAASPLFLTQDTLWPRQKGHYSSEQSDDERPHEKCGLFGISSPSHKPLPLAEQTLLLQGAVEQKHRGNNGAGAVMVDADGTMHKYVHSGSVPELVDHITNEHAQVPEQFEKVCQAVFHTRYTTSGINGKDNIQPFTCSNGLYRLTLAHNGNIPEAGLKHLRSLIPNTKLSPDASDSAVMTEYLTQERTKHNSWPDTLETCLPHLKGAFSLVMLTEDGTMIAARDVWGIRPLAIGQKQIEADSQTDAVNTDETNAASTTTIAAVASETPAFDATNIEYQRELLPGEVMVWPTDGKSPYSTLYGLAEEDRLCALEKHYFQRPDSFDGTATNQEHRQALGHGMAYRFLAKGITGIDYVVPVLNSGLPVAQGFAAAIDAEVLEAIEREPNANRSFIQATNAERQAVVSNKHSVSDEARQIIADKNIVIVDDSLIRGNSFADILKKVRGIKATPSDTTDIIPQPKTIHVALGAPPVFSPCDLGIAIADKDELLARQLLEENDPTVSEKLDHWHTLDAVEQEDILETLEELLAVHLEVDSVTFSTTQIVEETLDNLHLCQHCFGGKHPIEDDAKPTYRADVAKELAAQKILLLALDNPSIVDAFLGALINDRILAKPIGWVRDSSEEIENLAEYCQAIVDLILHNHAGLPDAIVLIGWQVLLEHLSDAFLETLYNQGVDIINLHPALVSDVKSKYVATSQGLIPRLHGADTIEQAHQLPLETMPVTGLSVQRVLPKERKPAGPTTIMSQEVRRRPAETLEELTGRIQAAGSAILPVATQRVLLEKLRPPTTQSPTSRSQVLR